MKARLRAIEEAVMANKSTLTDFSSTLEEAKVRKASEDEQRKSMETQLLEEQAEAFAKLEASGAARRAVLFGGLSAREGVQQATFRTQGEGTAAMTAAMTAATAATPATAATGTTGSTTKATKATATATATAVPRLSTTSMGAAGGGQSARGPAPFSSRQRTATERRQQLAHHADLMLSAKEDAQAVRQRILFGGPGGASKAVGEWIRSRPSQSQQLAATSRPPGQIMSSNGAPPFSAAPVSVLPRLHRGKYDEELEAELEQELERSAREREARLLLEETAATAREGDGQEEGDGEDAKTKKLEPESGEAKLSMGKAGEEKEEVPLTAITGASQLKVEDFAGGGHFWHRMQKLEVELLCNAVHLKRHREVLDDVWVANGGKPAEFAS